MYQEQRMDPWDYGKNDPNYRPKPENQAKIDRIRRANNEQQSTIENLSSASGGATRLTGQLLLSGSGEKVVDVVFPAPFTEKPLMSFGGEMQDSMIRGQFPTISVVVAGWITRDAPPYSRLFTGCQLAIVTTGPTTQKMIVHWFFDGPTITNFGIY
jgi:hypothetical protein